MNTYIDRDTLFREYMSTSPSSWETVMGSFAMEGVDCTTPLYYLSLDPTLAETFYITESYDDRIAKNSDITWQAIFGVPLPQRLLANTSAQECWNQIFPRIHECFRLEAHYDKPIALYLYRVHLDDCVVIDGETMAGEHILHNAHINNTHAVFGHPRLEMVRKLQVKNTLACADEERQYYQPFNDNRQMQCLLSTPLEILHVDNIR